MTKLCFGCMRQKENSPVCEHCGYDETKENQPHQLPVGTMLQNQYLVGRVLGQGGFGITYMGWDQHLSVPVAIKEYFPSGIVQRHTKISTSVITAKGSTQEFFSKHKDRFLKEARTLAQLSQIPEIVQIKSFFAANDTAYIVMEYVQGITLKDHLKKLGRPMTEKEALAIMEPVLRALQQVHDQKLIHRDISPDNIMLPAGGGVKLIDFGTVRYVDDSGRSQATEAVLKPGFAPMEQYNTRGNLGTWTDVYAICATFHYLLTGKVPADVHDRLDEGESLTLLRSRDGISKQLISALEQGMKIRAQERVHTIEELHQLLYAVTPEETSSPSQEQINPGTDRSLDPKRKKRTLIAACSAAAVVAVVVGVITVISMGNVAMRMILNPDKEEASPPTVQTTPATIIPESTYETIPETKEPITPESIAYAEAEQLLEEGETARAAIAFGKLAGYKDARERSLALWRELPRKTFAVAINGSAAIALKEDGAVVMAFASTSNEETKAEQERQQEIVSNWADIVSVSNGHGSWYGLKCDGTVVSVGDDRAAEWQDILRLPEDDSFGAVDIHGKIIGMGGNTDWEQKTMDEWSDLVMCANERVIRIGLKADGTVVSTGICHYCKAGNLWGWTDMAAIYAADHCIIGLRTDGTVLTSGGDARQLDAKNWKNIIAICTGGTHTVGLRADGSVVAVGVNGSDQCNVSEWTDIVDIDAASAFTVGLRSDGTMLYAGPGDKYPVGMAEWTDIQLPASSELSADNEPFHDNATKATVIAKELNIRQEPSTSSSRVGAYQQGETVFILEQSGDWGRTDKGWVLLQYLEQE